MALINKNKQFRYTLREETGLGFFVWFISTVGSTIITMMIMGLVIALTGVKPPFELLIIWVTMWVLYLIYTGVSLMYNAFEADRARLFETIKNGK
jgi:hypothetical protein